jgi:hypothetical protein
MDRILLRVEKISAVAVPSRRIRFIVAENVRYIFFILR